MLSMRQLEKTCAAGEWFRKDCIGSVTTWEYLVEKIVQKFYQLTDHNEEIEAEEDDDPDDITKQSSSDRRTLGPPRGIELNNPCDKGSLRNPMDSDNGEWLPHPTIGELPGMVRVRSMTYFQDHKCYGQIPYANFKIEKAHDPYLEINNIFGRNYDTSNTDNTQDNQENEERRDDPALEPSVCKIRRFEMMKYSFNVDEEYIAIKESEYLNHSKDNLDAY
ncbi:hypothetical protein Tco_0099020 [Tanacetum coccineum]